MNKKHYLAFILGLILISACTVTSEQSKSNQPQYVTDIQQMQTWPGTYQGILPCPNCEGIAIMLVLKPDLNYELRMQKLGIDIKDKTDSGKFSWLDKKGIFQISHDKHTSTYRMGHGFIELINNNGAPIAKESRQAYILQKTN